MTIAQAERIPSGIGQFAFLLAVNLLEVIDLAPRAGFELATLRLTPRDQFNQILPELELIEGNQQVVMKRSESFSPSLLTLCSQFAAIRMSFL